VSESDFRSSWSSSLLTVRPSAPASPSLLRSRSDDDDPFIVLTETNFCILPYTCLGLVLAPPVKG